MRRTSVLIAACTEIIEKSPSRAKDGSGVVFFTRGNAYLAKRDYAHAIADFNVALQLNPGNPIGLKYRGMAYAYSSDYNHAIADLEQALREQSDDARVIEFLVIAYNNRGLVYGRDKQYDRAVEDFSKALALKPNYPELLNNRGANETQKGDYDHAIEDFERTLQVSPGDSRAIDSLVIVYNTRARQLAEKGDNAHALDDFDRAFRLRPDDAGTLSNRGAFQLDRHNYDLALQDFNRALELNPKLAGTLMGRGAAHYGKHEFDLALKDYDAALQLDPGNKIIMFERDKTLLMKGEFNRAPGAAPLNEAEPSLPITVKNLPAFQSTFGAVKAGAIYRGFKWRGLYEINNQGSKIVITNFQVLWPPASFEGRQLKLVARSAPAAVEVFDDLDALIKSQQDKAVKPQRFPFSVPEGATRYVAIDFLFDVFAGGSQPVQFRSEDEAHRLLSEALGWKPNSDGRFDCLNEEITVEVATTSSRSLKFKSLTGLFVPGCALHMPLKPEMRSDLVSEPSTLSPASRSSGVPTLGKTPMGSLGTTP